MATVYRLSWKVHGFALPNPACPNCGGDGQGKPLLTSVGDCECADPSVPIERYHDYEFMSVAVLNQFDIERYAYVSDVQVRQISK